MPYVCCPNHNYMFLYPVQPLKMEAMTGEEVHTFNVMNICIYCIFQEGANNLKIAAISQDQLIVLTPGMPLELILMYYVLLCYKDIIIIPFLFRSIY